MFCGIRKTAKASCGQKQNEFAVGSQKQGLLREFSDDRSGAMIILAAVFIMIGFFIMAAVVDYGRWLNAKTDLRNAVDGAVLAAARAMQTSGSDPDVATQAAADYLDSNTQNIVSLVRGGGDDTKMSELISFNVVDGGTAVVAQGDVDIQSLIFRSSPGTLIDQLVPSFGKLEFLPIFRGSEADGSRAQLRVGGSAEFNIEVSMMLDITGSMGGSKLTAMQNAAKNMVDILVWDDQAEYTSKVALVPFSEGVLTDTLPSNLHRSTSSGSDDKTWKKVKTKAGDKVDFGRTDCVVERMESGNRYTDVAPNNETNRFRRLYKRGTRNCATQSPVVPLTNNKTALKNAIDGFVASGYTGGHIGTAWAWYMLSPNFGSFYPAASQPAPYNTEETKKYAVLMTDGEYNVQYCKGNNPNSKSGVRAKDAGGGDSYKANCNAPNGKSSDQARSLCEAMKDKGITVYTVGFQISEGGTADTTMRLCATSEDNYFSAANEEDLQQAFNDIALKISDIYLSK